MFSPVPFRQQPLDRLAEPLALRLSEQLFGLGAGPQVLFPGKRHSEARSMNGTC